MTSDPTNVSHTRIHISRSIVKHILQYKVCVVVFVCERERGSWVEGDLLCDGGIEEVASLSVEDALWLASGA